ncbi:MULTISPECIES: glycosyltransferase [Anaerolinea]|uniref:glycosyltransferase family 2 protein n=1 Tax=Anaerolinea TaxID=233189 RepID=UPI00262C31E9|nr:glycosyltransferase [Anaerolinea thermophila]
MPEVTVVLPTFNRADMILDAIRSVQAQTFQDWEIVVVDDGSTDNTKEIIQALEDPRIRYLYQENKGLPGARNTGIRNARAELIAFLDSDDAFLPEKLAWQVQRMATQPDLGLVAGDVFFTDAHLKPLFEARAWESHPTLTLSDWVLGCPIIVSATMVRRVWLEKAGYFDETMRYVEDWDLWLRLSYLGCPMEWLSKPVTLYRIHGQNMAKHAALMKQGMLRMFDKFFSIPNLPSEILDLKDQAYAHAYLNGAARAFSAGDSIEGKNSLQNALRINPTLGIGDPPQALSSLASFAHSPQCHQPEIFLQSLIQGLPEEVKHWKPQYIRAIFHATAAFEKVRQGKKKQVPVHALKAILFDPTWLKNRGLIAIALKSLISPSPSPKEDV